MSTNFYFIGHRGDDDPKFHIGKRSAGKGHLEFTWGMESHLLLQFEKNKSKVIEDEYGMTYTYSEFKEELDECVIRRYDLIGKNFC